MSWLAKYYIWLVIIITHLLNTFYWLFPKFVLNLIFFQLMSVKLIQLVVLVLFFFFVFPPQKQNTKQTNSVPPPTTNKHERSFLRTYLFPFTTHKHKQHPYKIFLVVILWKISFFLFFSPFFLNKKIFFFNSTTHFITDLPVSHRRACHIHPSRS